ncbi:LrgB family protein [Arthrobacter echini]|uniref:LrgB family protein n=1 Tax=Arthrobacter echini TaxID=1529066 RepID=A0A5D0XUK6_9MICC|nr:LrgB family protein [Arthrobacter echini]TYD00376.1 LrgB family protein [Arthrobacter echini]
MMQQTSDRKWFDELTLELRIRQVHGTAIGDTLASVRELLRDTGQSAEEAFGPAREYADSLDLPAEPKHDWVRKSLWPALLGLLAFLLFSQAIISLVRAEQMLVSPAQLALLLTPAVLILLLPLYIDALMRHVWVLITLGVIASLAGVLSAVVAPTAPAEAWLAVNPFPWVIGSALVMIAQSTVSTIRTFHSASDDDIIDPLARSTSSGTGAKVFVHVTNWLFPIFALAMLGLALALN